MRTLRLTLWLALALTFMPQHLAAQELDARVVVNHQQIQGSSTGVFDNLQKLLTELLNERQWTNLQYARHERITCNFNITVSKYDESQNLMECKLMVQSTRPVYNSNYTTTVFSTQDADFKFNFSEFDKLEFRADVIDNDLTALIAFYAYLIIGLDMDTMAPLGGTEALTMAQTIANKAQTLTTSAKGWKPFEDEKNRYALINGYLESAFEPFRQMQYKYYREGMDTMAENAERGRAAITEAIDLLAQARTNKPMSAWPMLFSEFKRDEIVGIYQGKGTDADKEKVSNTFVRINPSQNTYWRKIRQ